MKFIRENSSSLFALTALIVFAVLPFAAYAHAVLMGQADPSVDYGAIIQQVVSAVGDFRTGALIAGLLIIVNLLVNLTKIPWIANYVPADKRKWIALALGVVSAVLAAKVSGQSWPNAIVAGITAGLGSIGFHEMFQGQKPADLAGQVVAAAAAGDAKATAQVQGLADQLIDIRNLPEDKKAEALVEWAKNHPVPTSVVSGG